MLKTTKMSRHSRRKSTIQSDKAFTVDLAPEICLAIQQNYIKYAIQDFKARFKPILEKYADEMDLQLTDEFEFVPKSTE